MIDYAYPRLERAGAMARVTQLDGIPADQLRSSASIHFEGLPFRAVSADGRIDEGRLARFQREARKVADELGYPRTLSRDSARLLDQRLAGVILELLPMTEGEAATPEVWSFLGLMVVPDIVYWRNPTTEVADTGHERRLGTPSRRTVLQRAWWKASALGAELAGRMNEEETVAVMERSFSGYPPLAKKFMEEHFRRVSSGSVGRQALVRTAAKLLVRRMAVINVFSLHDAGISEVVSGVFSDAENLLKSGSAGFDDGGASLVGEVPSRDVSSFTPLQLGNQIVVAGSIESRRAPLERFEQETGPLLWAFVEPLAKPVDYGAVFALQNAIHAHDVTESPDPDLSQRLQFDLMELLDICVELDEDETAVVAGATRYFFLAEDADPDTVQGGLWDDNLVIAAAYSALNRVRLHG